MVVKSLCTLLNLIRSIKSLYPFGERHIFCYSVEFSNSRYCLFKGKSMILEYDYGEYFYNWPVLLFPVGFLSISSVDTICKQ